MILETKAQWDTYMKELNDSLNDLYERLSYYTEVETKSDRLLDIILNVRNKITILRDLKDQDKIDNPQFYI